MPPLDRFAPSRNGKIPANSAPTSAPDELLAQFKRIEEAWKKAEEKLASTHIPIDVRVKVGDGYTEYADPHEECPVFDVQTYLGYCRVKSGRRICVVTTRSFYQGFPDSDESEIPIVECPVDQRLEMFDSFQRLYDEAKAVAASYVPKIKDRVDKFEQSLACSDLF